jgi:hypothetical protein
VIDADAVAAVIRKCGGLREVMTDWCLDLDGTVVVHRVNPAFQPGMIPLLPDLAPDPEVVTRSDVSWLRS